MDGATVPSFLLLVAFATTLFVVVLGCVLTYHWMRYAMNHLATFIALTAYCSLSATLLLALFSSLYIL